MKKILVCDLPNWKFTAGFFVYPLMYINCILYCKYNISKFYPIPLVDYDDDIKNRYLDSNNIFWNNYFVSTPINNDMLNLEKIKLTSDEYNYIHHNFGIQTYPYGDGMYSHLKKHYDEPYTEEISNFYFENRKIANKIIKDHLKINSCILEETDKIISNLPKNKFIIGVHIRGTDKVSTIGGRKIEPDEYFIFIDYLIKKNNDSIIFLATDDAEYYNIFKKKYNDKVFYQEEVLRSRCNVFLDESNKNNYKKGKDVLVDCLCLSRCDFLIHQSSAVSEFAIYFNINLHNKSLNLQYNHKNFLKL